ncbi:MAG: histidine ammonia-lyase [Actinobacteria bacterium]|nr:histidine ammonia-lyase [Actinomycetota bacterium]
MTPVLLTGDPLSIDSVVAVARDRAPAVVDPSVAVRMAPARRVVEEAVARGDAVYGINTGFGALANVRIDPSATRELQHAIVRSHAAGTGDPVSEEIVRGMMLLRARTLAAGHTGARPLLVERIASLLTLGITPVVPEFGSVGASGDLAPLAHCALALIGEGFVWANGELLPASHALGRAGLDSLLLEPKEGLALINGTDGMLAMACLAIHDFEIVLRSADVTCAMSVEALLATDRPYAPDIHALRPHPGQIASAENLRRLTEGSAVIASHRTTAHAVQDAYSLRCAPQVHGACRDALAYARRVVEIELASEIDNPTVFHESGSVESAGNFHGEPLAFALDMIAIAASECASIAERRTDRMLDPAHSNGLPAFLAPEAGVNSGFMLAQYTQAALVAECRRLAVPASVDSIPTSGTTEDHVSMGWHAGLKAIRAVDAAARVVGIEALCAAQALEFRADTPSAATDAVRHVIRADVPAMMRDRFLAPDIERVGEMARDGALVAAAEEAIGSLA